MSVRSLRVGPGAQEVRNRKQSSPFINFEKKKNDLIADQEDLEGVNLADYSSKDGSVDMLLLQMEKQRVDLANDIQRLSCRLKRGSKSSGSRGTDSQKASSNPGPVVVQGRDQELADVLAQLDLANDVNVIACLEDEQRIELKSLISKYRNLLKLKRKYSNVENIDNESKSDYNDEADDAHHGE